MQRSQDESGSRELADDERLRGDGEVVETILGELSRTASPDAFSRVEELVQRLVGLYGAGLERVLEHVTRSGSWSDDLAARLADDELVSSLLALHGLHPVPAFERVDRALAGLRARLGGSLEVELRGIDHDGTARVSIAGDPGGCSSSMAEVEQAVRQLIEEAAPEVTGVRVEDAAARPGELVQIHVGPRPAGRAT